MQKENRRTFILFILGIFIATLLLLLLKPLERSCSSVAQVGKGNTNYRRRRHRVQLHVVAKLKCNITENTVIQTTTESSIARY